MVVQPFSVCVCAEEEVDQKSQIEEGDGIIAEELQEEIITTGEPTVVSSEDNSLENDLISDKEEEVLGDSYNIGAANEYAYTNYSSQGAVPCDIFVSRCLRAGGIDIAERNGSVTALRTNLQNKGFVLSSELNYDHNPSANVGHLYVSKNKAISDITVGDVIIFAGKANDPSPSHTALVTSIKNDEVFITHTNMGPEGNKKGYKDSMVCSTANYVCVLHYTGSSSTPSPEPSVTTTLNNPRKNSNGDTVWDCVWFGNYWQEDTNGDGVADENDRKQPIKWRVLQATSSDLFLLSDKCLTAQKYNEELCEITWEKCTLRSYLNGYGATENSYGEYYGSANFINDAFSTAEKAAIKTTTVVNDSSTHTLTNTDGGNNTNDKLFLLSYADIINSAYGFSSINDNNDRARGAQPTEYAKFKGAYVCPGEDEYSEPYNGNCIWWLRSPGMYLNLALDVDWTNNVYYNICEVNETAHCVRPALHTSNSQYITYAGTVCSDGRTNIDESEIVESSSEQTPDQAKVNGLNSTTDTLRVLQSGKKYIIMSDGGDEKVTLVTGSNTYIQNGKKKSFNSKNKRVAKVDKNGKITAKNSGTTTITYKTNAGNDVTLTVNVVKPALSYTDGIKVKNLNATITTGQEFDIETNIPLQAAFYCKSAKQNTNNNKLISGFKNYISDDGRVHISGTALYNKGTAKFPFKIDGKTFTIKIKVVKPKNGSGGFR